MAARTKKTDDDVKQKIVPPTRDEIKQATIWFATRTSRVPVLVGPTASGKTRMAMLIAEERNAKLITVLLQQDTLLTLLRPVEKILPLPSITHRAIWFGLKDWAIAAITAIWTSMPMQRAMCFCVLH